MAFLKAERVNVKAKICIAGVSGSGKTYSALRMATGLANGGMIGFIDTEGDRGLYYANKFDYFVDKLAMTTPENYIKKIEEAKAAGVKVLIIDSISHEWKTLMEEKDAMPGNSFANFAKISPRHDAFVKKILDIDMHVICTVRAKDKYVLEPNHKGKQVPSKVGLGLEQRDTLEYEFTTVLMVESGSHIATTTKDATNLFSERDEMITETHGEKLHLWCEEGIDLEDQILGTKKAVLLINFLKNKKNINLEKIEEYIQFRYEVSDVQYLKNKDKDDFQKRLKENNFNLELMISNNL